MQIPVQLNGNTLPIHPDVRFKDLPFFEVLDTLIKPSSLIPRRIQRSYESSFFFTLSPQQATEIAMNRDIRNRPKPMYGVQVHLRFCLVETSCEQDDCLPPCACVKVNNNICPLQPKRVPAAIDVTPHIKLSPTMTNTITINWSPDHTNYCIAVCLVKKLSSDDLFNRLKIKGIRRAGYTRAMIKEKLTEDADCEIATTLLKVSLNCPLGRMRMSTPCRALTCSHLQCFDANLFLQMNEKKPKWKCPVCNKPAEYNTLVIDEYFVDVLSSPLLKNEDTEIQLHKDGSWTTHEPNSSLPPTEPAEESEIMTIDLDLIDYDKPIQLAECSKPLLLLKPMQARNAIAVIPIKNQAQPKSSPSTIKKKIFGDQPTSSKFKFNDSTKSQQPLAISKSLIKNERTSLPSSNAMIATVDLTESDPEDDLN